MNYDDLPTHDIQNDQSISDARREACSINYADMELHHIDKIFTSAYVHDKKTGEPIAKKPRSLHELVYLMLDSLKMLDMKICELELEIENLKRCNISQDAARIQNNV